MPFQTDKEIEDVIAEALASLARGGDGFAPPARQYPGPGGRFYRPFAPFQDRPRSLGLPNALCFYYFKFSPCGKVDTHVLFEDGITQEADVVTKIETLIPQIRSGAVQGQATIENVEWKGPTFIAVFVDNADWRLIDVTDQAPKSFSVHFVETSRGAQHNRSFFGAKNVDLSVPVTCGVSDEASHQVLIFENHHLSRANTPMPTTRQPGDRSRDRYEFDVFYRLPNTRAGSNEKLTMIVDPGGHNTGPEL